MATNNLSSAKKPSVICIKNHLFSAKWLQNHLLSAIWLQNHLLLVLKIICHLHKNHLSSTTSLQKLSVVPCLTTHNVIWINSCVCCAGGKLFVWCDVAFCNHMLRAWHHHKNQHCLHPPSPSSNTPQLNPWVMNAAGRSNYTRWRPPSQPHCKSKQPWPGQTRSVPPLHPQWHQGSSWGLPAPT
jgi:hypothetical protein